MVTNEIPTLVSYNMKALRENFKASGVEISEK